MENRRQASVLPMIVTLAALAVVLALSSWAQAAGEGWPRRFEHAKGTVLLYQPQLESFKGDRLTARAAVSVQKKGWKQPVFGVVWLVEVAQGADDGIPRLEKRSDRVLRRGLAGTAGHGNNPGPGYLPHVACQGLQRRRGVVHPDQRGAGRPPAHGAFRLTAHDRPDRARGKRRVDEGVAVKALAPDRNVELTRCERA